MLKPHVSKHFIFYLFSTSVHSLPLWPFKNILPVLQSLAPHWLLSCFLNVFMKWDVEMLSTLWNVSDLFIVFKYMPLFYPLPTVQIQVLVRAGSIFCTGSKTSCLCWVYVCSLTVKDLTGRSSIGWHLYFKNWWYWFVQEVTLACLVACPHTWSALVYPCERRGEKHNSHYLMIIRIFPITWGNR